MDIIIPDPITAIIRNRCGTDGADIGANGGLGDTTGPGDTTGAKSTSNVFSQIFFAPFVE
jgi:hypothetical protein